MCVALSKMCHNDIITYGEYFRAKYEIQRYMFELNFWNKDSQYSMIMHNSLIGAGFNRQNMVKFYRKWDARPKPKAIPWYGKMLAPIHSFFKTLSTPYDYTI